MRVGLSGPDGRRFVHYVIGGGSSFGNNPLTPTIGLGRAEAIDAVEIIWPDGGTGRSCSACRSTGPSRSPRDGRVSAVLDWAPVARSGQHGSLNAIKGRFIRCRRIPPASHSDCFVEVSGITPRPWSHARRATPGRRGGGGGGGSRSPPGLIAAGLLVAFAWSEFYPKALAEAEAAYRRKRSGDIPPHREGAPCSRPFSRYAALLGAVPQPARPARPGRALLSTGRFS